MCDLPSAGEEEEEHEKRGIYEAKEERVQIGDERMWNEGMTDMDARICTVV